MPTREELAELEKRRPGAAKFTEKYPDAVRQARSEFAGPMLLMVERVRLSAEKGTRFQFHVSYDAPGTRSTIGPDAAYVKGFAEALRSIVGMFDEWVSEGEDWPKEKD